MSVSSSHLTTRFNPFSHEWPHVGSSKGLKLLFCHLSCIQSMTCSDQHDQEINQCIGFSYILITSIFLEGKGGGFIVQRNNVSSKRHSVPFTGDISKLSGKIKIWLVNFFISPDKLSGKNFELWRCLITYLHNEVSKPYPL